MNVVVRGPLLSMSGYGNHAREVYRWLAGKSDVKLSSQILPWGITPWHINPSSLNGLTQHIMERSVPIADNRKYDCSFQIQLPNEWDSNLATVNVGVTAAVETDKCNPEWVAACNRMDLVVVPSFHTKNCIENSGDVTTNIVVIPEAFVSPVGDPNVEPFKLDKVDTKINFLLFGQITGNNAFVDRKYTFFELTWLREEFADNPDVGIILKTNNGRNTSWDRKGCRKMLQSVCGEIKSSAKTYLLHGSMTSDEVAGLYLNKKVTALVSATRGEGFGLPILEAAASGLPVIATGWSAHCEFMNLGKWIKVEYDLVPVPPPRVDGQIFIEGTKWADVREQDFKKKVRKFYNANSKPKEWAQELSAKIVENYSFESISKKWDAAATEYLRW